MNEKDRKVDGSGQRDGEVEAAALSQFALHPDAPAVGFHQMVGNRQARVGAAGAPPAPTSGSLPLAKTGTPTTGNDACSPLPSGSLVGKAVLIRRGFCTFYQKASNAMQAGAAAVVLYNNGPGRFSPTVAGTPPITIPVVAVSDTEGVAINNAIDSGSQTLNWTDQMGLFTNPTGGLISSFSSYGLSPDLALKPDIGAPGGLIRSTYPLEQGGYATISGTSMSSPHVAGAVALLLEAKPHTNSQVVRTILQNSADPAPWWGNPALGFLDNVHRQGAGMLDIDDAILATTKIEPNFLVHLEHQVRRMRFEVFDANTGKAWHRVLEEQYLPRNSTSTSFFAFPWDGTTFSGNKVYTVPDGQYVVVISVLKALGDASNPAHWETWTSPVITIDRP